LLRRSLKYSHFCSAIQKPFVPPSDSVPLVVRSISYSGEEHPATKKRVVVVAISQLSLESPQATHKLKLLAGPRWSDKPPRDSGIGVEEDKRIGAHGYIKLSCEDFPEPAMNLKWGSDILDNLLKEANVCFGLAIGCVATDASYVVRIPQIHSQTFLTISDILMQEHGNTAKGSTFAVDQVLAQLLRTFLGSGCLRFSANKQRHKRQLT
jgi:Mitochondrial ribosomal subunit protein